MCVSKAPGGAPGEANAQPPGRAKFANASPPMTRYVNALQWPKWKGG